MKNPNAIIPLIFAFVVFLLTLPTLYLGFVGSILTATLIACLIAYGIDSGSLVLPSGDTDKEDDDDDDDNIDQLIISNLETV